MKYFILAFVGILLTTSLFSQFEEIKNINYYNNAVDIEAHDLDDDGDQDLLRTLKTKIVWYENLGDQIFDNYSVLLECELCEMKKSSCIDIDLDGDLDVVTIYSVYNSSLFDFEEILIWFENIGDGEFAEKVQISINHSDLLDFLFTDLNNDGFNDILCISTLYQSEKILWYENFGNGMFSEEQYALEVSEESIGPTSICGADFNGDGMTDIAFGLEWTNGIFWLENLGSETFGSPQNIPSTQTHPTSIRKGDLDGDGDEDLVIMSTLDEQLFWYENDGSGSFSIGQIVSILEFDFRELEIGDVNNDGFDDLICGNGLYDHTVWFPNNGSGVFGEAIDINITSYGTQNIFTADIDQDGDIDILSDILTDQMAYWYENTGDGTFENQHFIDALVDGIKSTRVGDIDNDGYNDILAGSESTGLIGWFKNNGNNEFGLVKPIYKNGQILRDLDLKDLDNDGDLDVLFVTNWGPQFGWIANDGNGNFGEINIIHESFSSQLILSHDFDDDGDIDLITKGIDDVIYWINDGTGNFINSGMDLSPVSQYWYKFKPIDVDLDGDTDIYFNFTHQTDPHCGYFENLGSGIFGEMQILYSDMILSVNSGMADLDDDGDLDLYYLTAYGIVSVVLNEGDFTFTNNVILGSVGEVIQATSDIEAHDIDYDGDIDIISTGCTDGVKIFQNDGSGNFDDSVLADAPYCPGHFHLADVDNDGAKDLITRVWDQGLYWYKNITASGCTDSNACNFDPEAIFENNECCYGICGCNDLEATNYDSAAECNNGECTYNISGTVFYDENENGIFDGVDETLALQEIVLEPYGSISITDDDGIFNFYDVFAEEITLAIQLSESYPFPTTETSISINLAESPDLSSIYFGLSTESPNYELDVNYYSWADEYDCAIPEAHFIVITNTSNVTLNTKLELQLDDLFDGFNEITTIDYEDDGSVFYSHDNLEPGDSHLFLIDLITPNEDFLGEFLASNVLVSGTIEEVEVAWGVDSLNIELTCAYDPNDKRVEPEGYFEQHYILDTQDLEYIIRFQNTGNAPATNIHIIDTLDPNLDWSSFEFISSSHEVSTSLNGITGEIDFFFENILLPDSINNEPESHGIISFNIRLIEGIVMDIEINNTANIYFDLNDPVVTNTTWNTIYDCDFYESSFEVDGTLLTAQESVTYLWFLNSLPIFGATNQTYEISEDGNYSLRTTNELGCIHVTSQEFLTVGIETYENQKDLLRLIPNPMLESSTIFLGKNHNYSYARIVDSNGKIVRDLGQINTDILVIKKEALGEGLYFIELFSSSIVDNITLKLIIR